MSSGWLRSPRTALFIFSLVAYAYFYQAGGWNQNVRFDLVRALVEQGTASIDAYRGNTGDLAERDGRHYLDKAPGTSWLAVPAYAAARPLLGVEEDQSRLEAAAWVSTIFAVGIPSAMAVVALFILLGGFGLSAGAAAAAALAYAIGTLAWPYATLFYGHQLAAALLLGGFSLLVVARWREERQESFSGAGPRMETIRLGSHADEGPAVGAGAEWLVVAEAEPGWELVASQPIDVPAPAGGGWTLTSAADPISEPSTDVPSLGVATLKASEIAARSGPPLGFSLLHLLAGLLLGYAVTVEYPAALAVAVILVYAGFLVRPLGRLAWLGVGLLLPAAALAVYHATVFGGPFTLPYEFSTQGHRAQGFFMGIGVPEMEALFGITFSSYRGLFFSAPWLLLALPGGVLLWRRGWRAETLVCASIFLLFLGMNASLVDWQGGWALGPRYLVPALPFLAILAAGCALWRPSLPWLRAAGWAGGAIAAGYAAFFMLAGTAVKPEVDVRVERPFADFVLPYFYAGELAVNSQGIDTYDLVPGERYAWNVGTLLGLDGLASLAPLLLLFALLGGWLGFSLRAGAAPRPASRAPPARAATA